MNFMAKTKRINLTLPERLADYVQAQVKSGHFQREADFIRHAIRKMQENEATGEFDLDAYIQKGIDSGRSPRSAQEIFENTHAKINEIGRQKKASNN